VFNLDQVDGCKLPKRFEPKLSHNQRIARAESFFAGVGVQVRDSGNRAFYRPDTPEAVAFGGIGARELRNRTGISWSYRRTPTD